MSAGARILEVTSYPPPRSGWAVRVEFLKKRLEEQGHSCAVLNTGTSRRIPSTEYETVLSGPDLLRKLWNFSARGYVVHAHANGDSVTGVALALVAALVNLVHGRRCYLTFHAGVIQRYFPRHRSWRMIPAYWLLFSIPKRVICNSEAVKACIVGYGVPASKVVPIPAFSKQYLEFTPTPLPPTVQEFFSQFPSVVFSYLRMRPLFFPLVLVDTIAQVTARRRDIGFLLCGGTGHSDPGVWEAVQARIQQHGVADRICFIEDLDHDEFLTVLQRSALYLRTPITDGVASSVLESLALGVPVVACENGTRPDGVITYPAEDARRMAEAVEYVLTHRAEVAARVSRTPVADTLDAEVALLTSHV